MLDNAPRTPIQVEVQDGFIITTFISKATDSEYADYLEEYTRKMWEAVRQYGRVVNIIDTTTWKGSTPTQRQMHSEWIKANQHVIRDHAAGIAFVIKSPLVRGGLTAVLWLARIPAPVKILPTKSDALRWGNAQLDEHGVRRG